VGGCNGKRVVDWHILSPSYLPTPLLHREEQIETVRSFLSPLLSGGSPVGHLFLYGPAGSGKTAVIRAVTEEIRRKAEGSLLVGYCTAEGSSYQVLARLAESTGVAVEKLGLSFSVAWGRFTEGVGGRPLIAVLDELDKHLEREPSSTLLYFLLSRERTCVVAASNVPDLLNRIEDPRVTSRFRPLPIYFPPYTASQIEDILNQRLEKAVEPGMVNPEAVQYCAALTVGYYEGDVRSALQLLSLSLSLLKGEEVLTPSHVDRAHLLLSEKLAYEPLYRLPVGQAAFIYAIAPYPEGVEVRKAYELMRGVLGKSISPDYGTLIIRSLVRQGLVEEIRRGRGWGRGVVWLVRLSERLDPVRVREITGKILGLGNPEGTG